MLNMSTLLCTLSTELQHRNRDLLDFSKLQPASTICSGLHHTCMFTCTHSTSVLLAAALRSLTAALQGDKQAADAPEQLPAKQMWKWDTTKLMFHANNPRFLEFKYFFDSTHKWRRSGAADSNKRKLWSLTDKSNSCLWQKRFCKLIKAFKLKRLSCRFFYRGFVVLNGSGWLLCCARVADKTESWQILWKICTLTS